MVHPSIGPGVLSDATAFVPLVLALEDSAVGPNHTHLAMPKTVKPLANAFPTIIEDTTALAVSPAVLKGPCVRAAR
eukprot:CAMPEP_0194481194 /NCGR_PEP_ID=MMETSP0253-20130528/3731_1 /TAXON_ID=2966 /ORGANISM="Noctiluca scintillans" /LENGTH=75 /DNA_ID=CAMNT_0039320663 /DNA_START=322 /DNA_END=549 /DNA_ORIENTATION=-